MKAMKATRTPRLSLIVGLAVMLGGVWWQLAPSVVGATALADPAEKIAGEPVAADRLSTLFREVAGAVKPAVVQVRTTRSYEVVTPRMPDMEDLFRRFFEEQDSPGPWRRQRRSVPREPRKRRYRTGGLGSGVIVDAKNGYILTNNHVVRNTDEVKIVLHDDRTFKAQWIRTDPESDLAIVKIAADGLTEASLGSSGRMEVGDLVLAIGAPYGLPQTVTAGIVSAKNRAKFSRLAAADGVVYQGFIQTDAAINPGNSGGPLVNMKGEVIGVNMFIVTRGGQNAGIGLAIPSDRAKDVLEQLVEKGRVVRGFLGVGYQDLAEDLAKSFELPETKGALVTDIVPDSPADEAGIEPGDIIVAADGKPITDGRDLRNVIASLAPESKVKITLYRNKEKMIVDVKLAERRDEIARLREGEDEKGDADSQQFGVAVETLTTELARKYGYEESTGGVIITEVDPDSDAAENGLRPGMVIKKVQGKNIASAEEFTAALADADAVRLLVATRSGVHRFVFITPRSADKPEHQQPEDKKKDE